MIKTIVTSALAGAFALGLATAALAGEFDNQCSWGLANGKKVLTDCSVNAAIKGKTYCFSNEQAKTEFMKNPDANLAKASLFYGEKHG
jgi:YHS domain-containing protein